MVKDTLSDPMSTSGCSDTCKCSAAESREGKADRFRTEEIRGKFLMVTGVST